MKSLFETDGTKVVLHRLNPKRSADWNRVRSVTGGAISSCPKDGRRPMTDEEADDFLNGR